MNENAYTPAVRNLTDAQLIERAGIAVNARNSDLLTATNDEWIRRANAENDERNKKMRQA